MHAIGYEHEAQRHLLFEITISNHSLIRSQSSCSHLKKVNIAQRRAQEWGKFSVSSRVRCEMNIISTSGCCPFVLGETASDIDGLGELEDSTIGLELTVKKGTDGAEN